MTHLDDPRYRRLAAECFAAQLDRLHAQLAGVREARDVECVHQARVASRRLRAALGVFCEAMTPKRRRRWRKAVRRLTQTLGHARDCDVQIAFLAEELAKTDAPAACPGLAMVLAEVERERAECQPQLLEEIKRFDRGRAARQMRAMTRQVMDSTSPDPSSDGSGALVSWAETEIDKRVGELLVFEGSLSRPEDVEEHHAMRIAAKRLRYAMELLAPAFEGRLKRRIKAARQIQTLLGVVHDCDVWVDRLAEFKNRFGKRRKRRYRGARGGGAWRAGLAHLGDSCRERRRRAFERLAALWADLRRDVCGQTDANEDSASAVPAVGKPHAHTAAPQSEIIHG